MCYADSNETQCLDCLADAPARITTTCQGSRNVVANYDSCLLRYSDKRFFGATGFTYGPDPGSTDFWIVDVYPNATDLATTAVVRSRLTGELWQKLAKIHGDDEDELSLEGDFEKGNGPKRFRYTELLIATNNFSDDRKLGEGGFGSVYRGFLKESNLEVAIKRVSRSSKQGKKEYVSEDSWAGGTILDVADARLGTEFDDRQMECVIIVGLWCAHPDRLVRPSIKQAVNVLQFEAPLPNLPSKVALINLKPVFHTIVSASQLTGGR
ncbi:hypothetical protein ACQ4PT_066694 [Festuca glaucescens]